jgi:hypothetical protein
MRSDSAALLRMINHTRVEAVLLGYSEAARSLDDAAKSVASIMKMKPETVLADEIFQEIEKLAILKSRRKEAG